MTGTDTNPAVTVDAATMQRRIIEPDTFIADTKAFVDVRIEGSKGKASYSFIGPGVSQNSEQSVNLTVPHGFNVGAASMPHGVVNNPHLHYTAEVFICTRGSFKMTIGRHGEQTLDIGVGDVFAAPTWVFRGFENTGPDDSWVFVVLGGDDTGGIIWSPDVLRMAAETGLYLAPDMSLIDTASPRPGTNGSAAGIAASRAPAEDVVAPVSDEALADIDTYTDADLEAHTSRVSGRDWSNGALLSSVLPGHASAMAPVLGFGMTEDRRHRAPIMTAQGFSVEWLRLAPGQTTGRHRLAESQVLLLAEGDWQITFNDDADSLSATPAMGSVVSIPPGAWRSFTNVGTTDAVAAIVCGTDSPNVIEWSPAIVAEAHRAGWVRDAAAKVAPIALVANDTNQSNQPSTTSDTEPNPGGNS